MITLDINSKIRATTQYTNWNFNSMVKFGDKFIGASDDGLFEICNDRDDGVPIGAYFEPITTDFGISAPKRMRYMYFGFEANGGMRIDVSVDQQAARTYDIPAHKTGQQRTRISIGRDGKGRYWSFRIKNINGANFSFDSVEVLPVVRQQGTR